MAVGNINLNIRDEFFSNEYENSYRQYTNNITDEMQQDMEEELDLDQDFEYDFSDKESSLLVNSITSLVEGYVQTLLSATSGNILNKIGINQENIELAQFIINLGKSAITKVESIIPFIPKNITMIPDAKSSLSSLTTSLKDMFMSMYVNVEHAYYETINEAITNFPSWEEVQKDAIEAFINLANKLIDDLCYKYFGKTLIELYYMCLPVINLYKKYKEYRTKKSEQEQNGIILPKEQQYTNLDFTFMADNTKGILIQRLKDSSDIIYNSFMLLTIRDTIFEVKDIIKQMHSIDLHVLVNNINQVQDVIDLLDEIGLNENAWTVNLSEAAKLGINNFRTQLDSLTKSLVSLGISTSAEVGQTAINEASNKKPLFDFKVDNESSEDSELKVNTLILNIYADPLMVKFKNRLSKVLLNTKAKYNGVETKIFSLGDTSQILNTIEQGYYDRKDKELMINNYKFIIHFELEGFNEEEKITEITAPSNNDVNQNSSIGFLSIDNPNYLDNIMQELLASQKRAAEDKKFKEEEQSETVINDFFNDVTTEEFSRVDLSLTDKRRPTLKLIHDLLAIINKFLPLFKVLATLISNYKTNKAKVEAHAQGNLFAMIKVIAKLNNLFGFVNKTSRNFYTIRTLKLYDYISDNLLNTNINTQTVDINTVQTRDLYLFLQQNNLDYKSLNPKLNSTLYIDTDQLDKQREELKNSIDALSEFFGEDASLFALYPKANYNDGTLLGIDKIQEAGNIIYYSDSSLPLVGSQILRALRNNYDPSI